MPHKVALLMGSDSDFAALEPCLATLKEFGIECTARVLSAHRTPDATRKFVTEAEKTGVKIFICAAGLAAHLAGAVAAQTARPVIGIPIPAGPLQGWDSLLSTVQMPPGVPVATVAIGGAKNAAVLAAQMLALADDELAERVVQWRKAQAEEVQERDRRLQEKLGGRKDP